MNTEQQYTDWNHCRSLWETHMRIEAAGVGYDFAAGRTASHEYMNACVEYRKKHGELFSPHDVWEAA